MQVIGLLSLTKGKWLKTALTTSDKKDVEFFLFLPLQVGINKPIFRDFMQKQY